MYKIETFIPYEYLLVPEPSYLCTDESPSCGLLRITNICTPYRSTCLMDFKRIPLKGMVDNVDVNECHLKRQYRSLFQDWELQRGGKAHIISTYTI
jgi:hypothetical protein